MSEAMLSNPDVDEFTPAYDLIRLRCGYLPLEKEAVLILAGEDRKGWLQGQVTNDLHHFQSGSSIAFCLCTPTGQIEAICTMWAFPDHFVITCDANSAEAVVRRVKKNVIMEDVRIERSDLQLITLQGPDTTSELGSLARLPNLDTGVITIEGEEVSVMRSNRTGSGGWDLLLPQNATKALAKIESVFAPIYLEAYRVCRLEAGYPTEGVDTDSKTMPPELGPAFEAQHVSYKKGCYSGQEVLMRIHSRGHTNRTWMALASEEPIPAGAAIRSAARPDAGFVTSSGFSPEFGDIAGAMLRNEAAIPGETVHVVIDGREIEARVYPMPLLRIA